VGRGDPQGPQVQLHLQAHGLWQTHEQRFMEISIGMEPITPLMRAMSPAEGTWNASEIMPFSLCPRGLLGPQWTCFWTHVYFRGMDLKKQDEDIRSLIHSRIWVKKCYTERKILNPYAFMLKIINTAVLLSVAMMHALRLGYQSPVSVGDVTITLWLSAIAVVGALLLAWYNWRAISKPGMPEYLKLLLVLLLIDMGGLYYSWLAGLEYWSLSGADFAWFILFDLIAIGIISLYLKKRS